MAFPSKKDLEKVKKRKRKSLEPPKNFLIHVKQTKGAGRKKYTLDGDDEDLLKYIEKAAGLLSVEEIAVKLMMSGRVLREIMNNDERIHFAFLRGKIKFKENIQNRLNHFFHMDIDDKGKGALTKEQITTGKILLSQTEGYISEGGQININNGYSGVVEHKVTFVKSKDNTDQDDDD